MMLMKQDITNYYQKEPDALGYCIECNEDIYAGSKYVHINGEDVCMECVNKAKSLDVLGWFGVETKIA